MRIFSLWIQGPPCQEIYGITTQDTLIFIILGLQLSFETELKFFDFCHETIFFFYCIMQYFFAHLLVYLLAEYD